MSLHYHSSTIPELLATAEEIRAAAREFNHDYPEALAEIDAGEPVIELRGDHLDSFGRRCRVSVTAVIVAPDGGIIYGHEPYVLVFNSRDGRVAPQDQGERRMRRHLKAVKVPVRKVRTGN